MEAVADVLRSGRVNYWTGSNGREFEQEFARFTGLDHAVFVANGTVALELALRALELPHGSEVITTPRTFIASSSAIVAAGLRPVFVDVDPDSGNITPTNVEAAINPRTSAVLLVHLAGWPADLPAMRTICDAHDLALIEDCSQAHGAMLGGAHVGTYGDVSAWSFCQDKIVTTGGEGGMVGTSSRSLWESMWSYKDHGKSWDAVYNRSHPPGFRWLHESFGTNWRATEMQAAIGRKQYALLPQWHQERTRNAAALAASLSNIPGLRVPLPPVGAEHAYYRLNAYVDSDSLQEGWTRDRILQEVDRRWGVPAFSGSCSEIYREQAFVLADVAPPEPLPVASRMSLESLAFLVHPGLTDADLAAVADAFADVMKEAVGAPDAV